MVAILIQAIEGTDAEMIRHDEPNDDKEPAMNRLDDAVQVAPSPPPPEEEAREPHASPAAPTTAEAAATTSDALPDKASFDRRDERRSAFASVQTDDDEPEAVVAPSGEAKQDQHDHDKRRQSQQEDERPSSRAEPPMPRPVAARRSSTGEPLPFASPQGYYHPPQRPSPPEGEQQHPYHYPRGYPSYHEGQFREYVGYPYPPHQHQSHSGSTSPAMAGAPPQYHHPPQYPPGYHHHHSQEYGGGYHPQYSYHHQYPAPHSYPGAHYPGQTPPSSHTAPGYLKETPSAVTEESKGTTPSASARKPSLAEESLDLSPSHSLEDDRKPAASEGATAKGILKKEPPLEAFEPIPLDQIAAIPVLSDPGAIQPDAYSSAYEYESPYAQQAAVAAAAVAHVAPPAPSHRTPARRRQNRTIAPSSSGSASAGSAGTSWERRYEELIEFKAAHGHCEVPQNYTPNTSLGTWVNKQRMEHKNRVEGKTSSLNDSRLERLQRVGFRWAKRKGQVSWNEKFNELVAYKAEFGNCHVPTKYKHNTALGRWVSTQRAEYKKYQEGTKTSMNADKVRRLEGIGFAWFMAL